MLERVTPHIAIVTLDDGTGFNKLSDGPLLAELIGLLEGLDAEPDLRVMVLVGSGKAFSSGGDIRAMHERTGTFAGSPAEIRAAYVGGIHRLCRAMAALEIPVIAAVNGPAYGAGCDLAMMCDLRIGCEKTVFAESFVRLGLIPGDGGSWFLTKVAGAARAAEMILTGDPIDAETASDWGLISRLVPAEVLMAEALRLAERIATAAPLAVRGAKRLLQGSYRSSLDQALEEAASWQAILHHSRDHHEAVAAFLERRPPNFTGT